MKTLFHAMERNTLDRFIESKQELLVLASTMSTAEREAGRREIMEAATLFDVPEGQYDPRTLYSVDPDGTAHVPVRGKLVAQADICDGFFSDVTTYGFITAAAQAADADPTVKKICFDLASGGGGITGLDSTARVLASLTKQTEGRISGMCASACYWLGSQLDRLVATSPTDFIGSIGVAMEIVDSRKADETRGVKRHVLTSTDAPDKRPDIATEEGQQKYIAELDALHEVFVARVMEGRKTDRKKVDDEYGKGGLLIASAALAAGMIDAIEGQSLNRVTPPAASAAAGNHTQEVEPMATLAELLATNPAARAEHDNLVADARVDGIKAGQDAVEARVSAASPYLANPAYPRIVAETAAKVVAGTASPDSLLAAVAAVDAVTQRAESDAAAASSAAAPATPAAPAAAAVPGALVASEADLDALIAASKGGN